MRSMCILAWEVKKTTVTDGITCGVRYTSERKNVWLSKNALFVDLWQISSNAMPAAISVAVVQAVPGKEIMDAAPVIAAAGLEPE